MFFNKRLFLTFSLVFISLIVPQAIASGWGEWVKISQIIFEGPDDNQPLAFLEFNVPRNPDRCADGQFYARIPAHTKKGQYMVQTALTAVAAGLEVMPLYDGCDNYGRPLLTGFRIRPSSQ